MRITFELESADIEYFQGAFDSARRLAADADEVDVIDAAKHALDTMCTASIPTYVRKRLVHVQRLILMLEDEDWNLRDPERSDALAALAYFGDPDDLIPDQLAVIGLVDDAIMLELLARRMRHVLLAYRQFCDFRNAQAGTSAGEAAKRSERAGTLARFRAELMEELKVRRKRQHSQLVHPA
jgi:uncharacterized membrane protein YkvA (DUF1232 family)